MSKCVGSKPVRSPVETLKSIEPVPSGSGDSAGSVRRGCARSWPSRISAGPRGIQADGGAASSPLVVVNQLSSTRQRVESGQEIVMMSAGSAVQHDDRRPGPDAPFKDFNAAY